MHRIYSCNRSARNAGDATNDFKGISKNDSSRSVHFNKLRPRTLRLRLRSKQYVSHMYVRANMQPEFVHCHEILPYDFESDYSQTVNVISSSRSYWFPVTRSSNAEPRRLGLGEWQPKEAHSQLNTPQGKPHIRQNRSYVLRFFCKPSDFSPFRR